jgi:hypothetical protein
MEYDGTKILIFSQKKEKKYDMIQIYKCAIFKKEGKKRISWMRTNIFELENDIF